MATPFGPYPSYTTSSKLLASFELAFLIAASTFALGILTALAVCMAARKRLFELGSGPLAFTAMAISLPILVKAFDMAAHLLNFLSLRYSNALPIIIIKPCKYN